MWGALYGFGSGTWYRRSMAIRMLPKRVRQFSIGKSRTGTLAILGAMITQGRFVAAGL